MDKFVKVGLTIIAGCFMVGCGTLGEMKYATNTDSVVCSEYLRNWNSHWRAEQVKEIRRRNLDCSKYQRQAQAVADRDEAFEQGLKAGAAIAIGAEAGKSLTGGSRGTLLGLPPNPTSTQARLLRQHNNGVTRICIYCCRDGHNFSVTYRANQMCPASQ